LSTTRINNVSLFVTVLSACLGLLAVGMPAQVYAQQAVRLAEASAFPREQQGRCDEEALSKVEPLINLDAFFPPVREFIADLKRLVSIGKYQFGEYDHVAVSLAIPKSGVAQINISSQDGYWTRAAAADAANKFLFIFDDATRFYSYDEELQSDLARLEVAFHLDRSGLGIHLGQEQKTFEQAQKLAANYNASFALAACRAKDEFERSFYENTKALVKENKILIITNLPRAALENPPAEQPAAN
jgi:hypothetical protein